MRVFLHDLVSHNDSSGFRDRIDQFLKIAAKHKIRPMLVLFDSCWDPFPKSGPQRAPKPGVHNSGWVQGPGSDALTDSRQYGRLKAYVEGVVGSFAKDKRILAWDIWNEPDNLNNSSYMMREPARKVELVNSLLEQAFYWARSQHPTQPLTSGIWKGGWNGPEKMTRTERIQLENSDVISFHNYGAGPEFERIIKELQRHKRPILCTEYMARGNNSTFESSMPIAKKYKVAAMNWGLVAGKTQTYLPWDSWKNPYVDREPAIWFHEVFKTDGTAYKPAEIELIRSLTRK